jgi:regulator of protease activity HflC (stomatin/prohibitin superfamily)
MISSFIILIGFLVAVGWAIANRKKIITETPQDRYGETKKVINIGKLFLPILIFVVCIITAAVQPFTIERVEAGQIGLKVNLTGDERGVSKYTYKTGWVTYNEWTEMLYMYPTSIQHIEYGDQQVITKGGFSATINPTFNYSLVPDAVGEMFQQLRMDIKTIEQGWLKTAIIGSVADVANKWEVDAIFNNREQFELAIVAECNKRVGKWFLVDQLRTNIVPPPALQEAIVNKTKAIQETQAKIQEALVAEANAQKMIQIAKGDSAKAVIEASGRANALLIEAKAEADAIKLKQQQLTDLMVQYEIAQKWNGALPTTMLGDGAGTFINLK